MRYDKKWQPYHAASGASGWQRFSGKLHARISKRDAKSYSYSVTEYKDGGEMGMHQRGHAASFAGAKAAASKILAKFHAGTKECIHCGRPVPAARVTSVCNRCIALYRRSNKS